MDEWMDSSYEVRVHYFIMALSEIDKIRNNLIIILVFRRF